MVSSSGSVAYTRQEVEPASLVIFSKSYSATKDRSTLYVAAVIQAKGVRRVLLDQASSASCSHSTNQMPMGSLFPDMSALEFKALCLYVHV